MSSDAQRKIITYAVFHQPNTKFPQKAGATLGFKPEQIKPGLLVPVIGNTYAGSSLIGLTAILDIAKPGDRILMVSYGSGAGSDAFSLIVTEKITERQKLATQTRSTSPAAPRSIMPCTRASATRSTWDKGRPT